MSVQQNHAAPAPPTIRWLRDLLAGFLAEVALIFVAIPLSFLPNFQTVLNVAIPPASFVVLVAFGYWAALERHGSVERSCSPLLDRLGTNDAVTAGPFDEGHRSTPPCSAET